MSSPGMPITAASKIFGWETSKASGSAGATCTALYLMSSYVSCQPSSEKRSGRPGGALRDAHLTFFRSTM